MRINVKFHLAVFFAACDITSVIHFALVKLKMAEIITILTIQSHIFIPRH